MKYIIDEEELAELLEGYNGYDDFIADKIKDFLQFKQPIVDKEMTVSVNARIFDDGTIKIDSNEDITTKLRPLRSKNVIITFEEDK